MPVRLVHRFALLLSALCCSLSQAEFTGLSTVVSGLSRPVFVTAPPGDTDRLFAVQKGGGVRIINLGDNTVNQERFVLVENVFNNAEGGLLGMAFHPDYANNGKFYVHATIQNDTTPLTITSHIYEYTVSNDPDIANPTPRQILSFDQPTFLHNGGWIGFNPQLTPGQPQYLHIGSGDGNGNPADAQDTNNLFGSILRIDVDGDDFPADPEQNYAIPADNPFVGVAGRDEVWSYGLRNPWRNSFDSKTGDLWIGDVGGGIQEEVNFQSADNPGGDNYAWNRREGTLPVNGGSQLPGDVEPVYDYPHNGGSAAVVGGYLYRGPDADEQGRYFFGDNPQSEIFAFDPDDPYGTVDNLRDDLTGSLPINSFRLVSFGTDAVNNLYAVDIAGSVLRFEPGRLAGDYNSDGMIGDLDYALWASTYGSTTTLNADGNGDGVVDAADYAYWRDSLNDFGAMYPEVPPAPGVPEPTGLAACLIGTLLAWRGRK